MLGAMRTDDRGDGDLFDDLRGSRDEAEDGGTDRPSLRGVAQVAGVGLVLMVLTSLGAIGGAWAGSRTAPDVEYTTAIWEGIVVVLWCLLWGVLAGAAALAVGFVAVGLPWARRRRG